MILAGDVPGLVLLTYLDAGVLERARRGTKRHDKDAALQAEVALHGHLVRVKSVGAGRRGGGPRGPVCGFSRASRKRCLDFFNSLDRRGPEATLFVTLTYPIEWSSDWKDWKRHLDVFKRRFKRRYPGVPFFWRLEFQKRGAPHFHLLVFGLEAVSIEWLSSAWYEAVGSGDAKHLAAGSRVGRIRSWRMAGYYVSKYAAKEQITDTPTGRVWGVIERSVLAVHLVVVGLTPGQFYLMRRVMRRWLSKVMGKKVKWARGRSGGLTCYMDSAAALRLLAFVASF